MHKSEDLSTMVNYMSITSVCFAGGTPKTELYPDTTYGTTSGVHAVVYSSDSKAACYISFLGNLYLIEDIQKILDEARKFHDKLTPKKG